jgi:cellulose synthase/poly-beta-1,6-N-acetylglucosamine synthase-like glycosyltransferase
VIKCYDRLGDDRLIQLAESKKEEKIERKSDSYKLSVVVPLYNSELFMCRTIDAILSSTLDSIELILVNDGSKDNTLEICNRYKDNYSCVRVLDQEN